MTSRFERLSRFIGGVEQVGQTALPVEEFAHPWPLLAMALLGVNDHLLKGSGWLPGWLTGKLSDFAGLFFFPLFVTAALDSVLYVLFRLTRGRTPDYSLGMSRLVGAVIFTAILFVPLKLSDTWGTLYIEAMHALDVLDLFGNFQVTKDPTDLVALVMFPLVLLHGTRFVRRIPIGRLQVLTARVAAASPAERDAVITRYTRDVRRGTAGSRRREEALDRFLDAFAASLRPTATTHDVAKAQTRLEAYREALEQPA